MPARRFWPGCSRSSKPKRVDHDERRTQIAEALIRVAGRRGLHPVGMRDVAAEAGVSLQLVQYYFQIKESAVMSGFTGPAVGRGRAVQGRRHEEGGRRHGQGSVRGGGMWGKATA